MADSDVRHRLARVLGAWWRGHGPRGKALLGALLLPARKKDMAVAEEASVAAAAGVVVDLVLAGTGDVLRRGYTLPTTGHARQLIKALAPLLPTPPTTNIVMRLFHGCGGAELRPSACMDTFEWPEGCDKELVCMPCKQFTGRVKVQGRQRMVAVHTPSNTIAVYSNVGNMYVIQITTISAGGILTPGWTKWRDSNSVLCMQFSYDGSVLIVLHRGRGADFVSVTTGMVLHRAAMPHLGECRAEPYQLALYNTFGLTSLSSTASVSNDTLRGGHTLVSGALRYEWRVGVIGATSVCAASVPIWVVSTGHSMTDVQVAWSDSVILAGGFPEVAVSTKVMKCALDNTTATHVYFVCLQTAKVLREISVTDAMVRIYMHDDPGSFWMQGEGMVTRMRRTANHDVVPMERIATRRITLVMMRQIPHRQPASFIVKHSTRSVTQHIIDATHKCVVAKDAWPLEDGERFVLRETNGSLNVVRL